VWPWLAQIGQGRGGLYSYDFLENLVGCDIHSADRILPEHQQIAVGDLVRMGPQGYPVFRVEIVEPGHALVLIAADNRTAQPMYVPESPGEEYNVFSWAFVLVPVDEDTTRLVVRARTDSNLGGAMPAVNRVLEAVQFFMEQKMMRGIQQRAEGARITWW
jgi:hypothetical protein